MKKFLAGALVLAAATAHAGGQFLPVRGVRPAARGGAFVAGADDPGALWYNPAGLAELLGGARLTLVIDAALVGHEITYTRIDSGGNTLPPVSSEPQTVPLPTLAAQLDLGPRLSLGFGVLAPWTALDEFPEDGPQRYSLVSLHHSILAMLEIGAAYRVSDRFSVGVGVQNLVTRFRSTLVFSACPGEIVCAPEDPEFDAVGEIDGTSYFAPSAVIGVQARPLRLLRLGAALQLPVKVSTRGTVRVRLPPSGFFDGARVAGDRAEVELTLPMMLRAGVELAPSPLLRVEAGVDLELWSQQEDFTITPRDVRVEDAAGVGTYALAPMVIPRKLEDTLALRLGLEARPLARAPLTLRAGYVNESGASTDEYVSVLTVDTHKHVLTVGLGYSVGRVRLDAVYGHVFMSDRVIAAGQSCAPQQNPIRGGEDPTACVHDGSPGRVYVGDGTYRSSWDMVGVGLSAGF
jgi:long-chain fatty acid transport protein